MQVVLSLMLAISIQALELFGLRLVPLMVSLAPEEPLIRVFGQGSLLVSQ